MDHNSSKQKEVRTRFAPSPSGFLHVGGARTALFNYLYAKACKGKFILRIEDTDQERSSSESEQVILESLAWLGIHADEGPYQGGPYAPYRQSERLDMYKKYTDTLLADGSAYPCFCSDEELEEKQNQSRKLGIPHIYDGKCRHLSEKEREAKIKNKERYAIRFHVEPSEIVVNDLVQGKVKFDSKLIGDFIIVKSDGFPSYNYAVVIDDYEMQISHVIRGVGHLSNTPRQILIHQALNLPLPEYSHISEIVGTDRKKLSKRRGATSVLFFRDLGYLSEAFVNYMALLGWYPEDGVEFMPDGKLTEKFDVHRCSKSPAMFDFFLTDKTEEEGGETFDPSKLTLEEIRAYINQKTKLNFLNNKYIRHITVDEVLPLALPFIESDPALKALQQQDPARIKLTFEKLRVYLNTLSDTVPYMKEIFHENLTAEEGEAREMIQEQEARQTIGKFIELLKEKQPGTPEEFGECMKETGRLTGAKGKALYHPIRVASTGTMQGLELPTFFAIIGYEAVIQRIETILNSVISKGD